VLERLVIRDLALVDRAEVRFGSGLNVLTGETGAGKSLVVQAVSLLLGGRADADAVREGATAATVEGEFRPGPDLAPRVAELLGEWGLEPEGETVILRREIQAAGRSRAGVNQSPVTQAALRRLGEILVDLHGQHEHQSLLRPGAGVETLDRLGGLGAPAARYAAALAGWRQATAELDVLEASLADYAERRDHLIQAARDLDETRPVAGEEEELAREAGRLAHTDRLRELAGEALARLSDGDGAALDGLNAAARALEQARALDPGLDEVAPALDEARIAAGEVARTLAGYAASLEADPAALESVESRREALARLKRRYRRDLPGLIAWREEIARELATGEDAEGARARAHEAVRRAAAECAAAGDALSQARRAAAADWTTRLTRELKPLGFDHAQLEFSVTRLDPGSAGFGAQGLDEVEMRFTANPGEPPRPLQKIASGGELSRVMLALKTALEAQDRVDVLLFDEVDSGIGGAVARAVGERLRRLSQHRQLICVTHLPMIAALGTHHLRVTKHRAAGRTVTRIEPVAGEPRVEELSRMLAGDRITETTRRQARELLGDVPLKAAPR